MKGIILAGGSGTRLYPLTLVTSKQLLPVYDKPMIYYPLSVLMLARIQEILIITTPEDSPRFQALLKDGSRFGIRLSYAVQEKPEGLAQAFLIGKEFIGDDACALILGDNIFYGDGLTKHLKNSVRRAEQEKKCTLYGYFVKDPERFGVVGFDEKDEPISIEEKPKNPKSNYAVTGLYFYPKGVVKMAEKVKKSKRGEYEITTLNKMYLRKKKVHVTLLGRGYSWLDAGTHESLNDASQFIQDIEEHEGLKICCPEEIAYRKEWISREQLIKMGEEMQNNQYGQHLLRVSQGRVKGSNE